MTDTRLPAAMTHKGVIFGDASRRAEDEAPGELGRILVTATRSAGAAHRDAAVAQRCHIERGVAHAGGDQQFELRQAVDDAFRERGALTHRRDDLAVGERAHDILGIGERKALYGDLDAAGAHRRPIRHIERDALIIIENAEPHDVTPETRMGFASLNPSYRAIPVKRAAAGSGRGRAGSRRGPRRGSRSPRGRCRPPRIRAASLFPGGARNTEVDSVLGSRPFSSAIRYSRADCSLLSYPRPGRGNQPSQYSTTRRSV